MVSLKLFSMIIYGVVVPLLTLLPRFYLGFLQFLSTFKHRSRLQISLAVGWTYNSHTITTTTNLFKPKHCKILLANS